MDFTGDLYGKTLNVECVKRQRGELKFDSIDGLVEQMHRDAAEARAILAEPIGADAPSLLPL
jgi:riboflavin kinase/FMN adenylyltransferase